MQAIRNMAISTATMVEPTGVPARIDKRIPKNAQKTERRTEHKVTLKNVLKIRMADSAGNIINAEVNREPTRFMASTMMIAVITAISKLYIDVRMPMALAKFSSKVIEKIL